MNITIFTEHKPEHPCKESQYPYKDKTQVLGCQPIVDIRNCLTESEVQIEQTI